MIEASNDGKWLSQQPTSPNPTLVPTNQRSHRVPRRHSEPPAHASSHGEAASWQAAQSTVDFLLKLGVLDERNKGSILGNDDKCCKPSWSEAGSHPHGRAGPLSMCHSARPAGLGRRDGQSGERGAALRGRRRCEPGNGGRRRGSSVVGVRVLGV